MEHILGLTMYAVVDIDAGRKHVIANTLENGCFAWGSNSHGQLGFGETLSSVRNSVQIKSNFIETIQRRNAKTT